jgi:cysteine desulfurase/selenocysteine lyase
MALLEASSLNLPALFPGLGGRTFLNTATMGQLPATANQALIDHLQRREQTAATDAPLWFDALDRLRAKLASLIHASPTDIAFIPSTAHGLAIPLQGLDWQPGDEILTLDPEFPNNTYAPAQLARRGVLFREVPLASLPQAISPRTRLIIVSALNYSTGLRAPIPLIRSLAPHALLYVDGTQGLGGIALDAPALGIDILAVHGYKWLLSPTGAGFVYINPASRLRIDPHIVGWRSHHAWRDWSNLHHGPPVFSSAAERYEGYFPAVPLYLAMEQSIDLFLQLGPHAIEDHNLTLAAQLHSRLASLGASVLHDNSPLLACRFPHLDSNHLAAQLNARNIICSARHGHLRLSLHLYNTPADLSTLVSTLSSLL